MCTLYTLFSGFVDWLFVVVVVAVVWRSYFWQLNACGDGEDDDDGSCLVGCYVACRILSVIISPRASAPYFFLALPGIKTPTQRPGLRRACHY